MAGSPVSPASGADQAKQLLGVLPDGLALPRQLTGRELLTYLGLLRLMPAAVVAARIDGTAERARPRGRRSHADR